MKRTLIILYMLCAAAPILCAQSVIKSGWESWMAQIAQNNYAKGSTPTNASFCFGEWLKFVLTRP